MRIRRYRDHCGNRWREDTTTAAHERAKLSRGGMRWALEALVIDHLSVARVAAGLGVAWHTANDAVLAEGPRLLIDDPARFETVRAIGVDEPRFIGLSVRAANVDLCLLSGPSSRRPHAGCETRSHRPTATSSSPALI